jgi:hypothetical protein
MIKDMNAWGCTLIDDSDIEWLEKSIRTRGVRIVLEDLPELGKSFDKAISDGYWDPRSIPSFFPWHDWKGPGVFRLLLDRVFDKSVPRYKRFDQHYTWYPLPILWNPCPNSIFFFRTLCYAFKKFEVECPSDRVRETVETFFRIDEGLREPTLTWELEAPYFEASQANHKRLRFISSHTLGDECNTVTERKLLVALDEVCARLWANVPEVDISSIVPGHGPGAVGDLRSSADKYTLPNWTKRLEESFPQDLFAFSSEEIAKDFGKQKGLVVPPGQLTAVPKDFTKPRLITVEPTSHQFLQQGLMQWIRRNLPDPLRHSIDFLSQQPSRDAARKASVDLQAATVDLSSASDRLSLWTVERAIRNASLLRCLYACRTPDVIDATGLTGQRALLKKFAGQGSAVTFPIQSIIYACCGIAAVCVERGWTVNKRNILRSSKLVRVFGDDIVLPKSALIHLDVIFSCLQLRINVGKTHYSGRFRESCGGDYYDGHDVTPLYIRRASHGDQTVRDVVSLVDVSNNAYEKGMWHTSHDLLQLLPPFVRDRLVVSNIPQSCLTLRTHQSPGFRAKRVRFNTHLQSSEIWGLVPILRSRIVEREGINELLSFFLEFGKQRPLWEIPVTWDRGYSLPLSDKSFKLRERWVLLNC